MVFLDCPFCEFYVGVGLATIKPVYLGFDSPRLALIFFDLAYALAK